MEKIKDMGVDDTIMDIIGENNYFTSFIRECLRDLKLKHNTFVFNMEQVEEIKKTYKNIEVKEDDGIFYIKKC